MNIDGLTISALGDAAVTLNFENTIDETINRTVLNLFDKLKKQRLPFVKDIVPSYSSLTIFYDLLILENKKPVNKSYLEIVLAEVKKLLAQDIKISPVPARKIKIPVCYGEKFARDLKDIAREKNLPVDEIIRLHTAKTYRVYMIGFLPGFPYMGEIDERLAMPRRMQPRTKVEAGSVGIAGRQTGIYSLDSPGGWQIIGKTPLQLFNKEKDDPVLLQPGDEIAFYSITEDEFAGY